MIDSGEVILKPCPCCGGEGKFQNSAIGIPEDKTKWVVNCIVCTMSTSLPMHSMLFASEVWNRRVKADLEGSADSDDKAKKYIEAIKEGQRRTNKAVKPLADLALPHVIYGIAPFDKGDL